MQIGIVLLGIYGILFLISGKIKLEKQYKKWEIPFYKLTAFLQKKIKKKRKNNNKKQQLQSLWITHRITWEEYETKKIAVTLMILFGTLCVSVMVSVVDKNEAKIISFLKRPLYGEAKRTEELDVWVEEKQKYKIPVSVQARKYSVEEARQKVEIALSELEEVIKGENTTLDEVRSDLILPESMQNGAVQIEWTVIPYGIISQRGEILKETKEEGEVVKLEAMIQCQEEKANYSVFARIFPIERTEEEEMFFKIENAVKEQDEKERDQEKITLPEKLDGKEMRWEKTRIPSGIIILVSGIISAFYFWNQRDQKLEKMVKKRQEQLKKDYVVLLFKIRMLLGAGMTIRGAFMKIASQYEERERKDIRYVYEEVVHACREMENGLPEEVVYEQFGQRCGQPRYLKLGHILAQHLKKGMEGLEEILEQEMQQAQEERIELARKKGEETGVKLLIPMGMMLIVVLAVLMIPAFLSI